MSADSIPAPIAAACEAVRPATDADAVAGVQPTLVAQPATTQEASELLRAAADFGLAAVPAGTRSRLHWGTPPTRCDLLIETTRLDRVVEHAAGDLVATVQAGVSLEQLADVLAAAGQRLALDPPARQLQPRAGAKARTAAGPRRTRGTVGGVLATGVAGPLRLRYGTGRDLLIGITIIRADGTVAHSGGKVVKNVAGYDLGKLVAGSRGTLALITEATFRLHPIPAATAYVTATCADSAEAGELVAAALDAPLAAVAAEIDWPAASAPVSVGIALEGDERGVAERAELLGRGGVSGTTPAAGYEAPPWWGVGPAAHADGTVVQIAFWPGELSSVLAEIRSAALSAGLDPPIGGSAAGVLCCALDADEDAGKVAAFVTGLRAGLARLDGATRDGSGASGRASVVVLHAPAAVRGLVDMFGPVQSLALMRAVKNQFDPDHMLAPGRFAGGI